MAKQQHKVQGFNVSHYIVVSIRRLFYNKMGCKLIKKSKMQHYQETLRILEQILKTPGTYTHKNLSVSYTRLHVQKKPVLN